MYSNFWAYAIFVLVALCGTHYLNDNCFTNSKDFGSLMVFLSYLVISYIVATSIRQTILTVPDQREQSVKLSFDSLIALYILATAYCKYGGMIF